MQIKYLLTGTLPAQPPTLRTPGPQPPTSAPRTPPFLGNIKTYPKSASKHGYKLKLIVCQAS